MHSLDAPQGMPRRGLLRGRSDENGRMTGSAETQTDTQPASLVTPRVVSRWQVPARRLATLTSVSSC